MRGPDGFQTCGRDGVVAARLATALVGRIAHPRTQAALGLETIQARIERSARDRPGGPLLDQLADRHGVGLLVEVEDRQQDRVFEFAEVNWWHDCNAGYTYAC